MVWVMVVNPIIEKLNFKEDSTGLVVCTMFDPQKCFKVSLNFDIKDKILSNFKFQTRRIN